MSESNQLKSGSDETHENFPQCASKDVNNKDSVHASVEGVPENNGEVKPERHSEVTYDSPEDVVHSNEYANVENSVVTLESTQDIQVHVVETLVQQLQVSNTKSQLESRIVGNNTNLEQIKCNDDCVKTDVVGLEDRTKNSNVSENSVENTAIEISMEKNCIKVRTDSAGDTKTENSMESETNERASVLTADDFTDFDFMIISDMLFKSESKEHHIVMRKIPLRLRSNLNVNDIEEPEAGARLSLLHQQVAELCDDALTHVRFYTADPNSLQVPFGDPEDMEWVRLDGGITIKKFAEIFKKTFVKDGEECEGHLKPLLVQHRVCRKAKTDRAGDTQTKTNERTSVKTADDFTDFDFMMITNMIISESNEKNIIMRKVPLRMRSNLNVNDIEEPDAGGRLSLIQHQVLEVWLSDEALKHVRSYTADPNSLQFQFGDPDDIEDWVSLDGGITIKEFAEIFKESFAKDGEECEGHLKPLLVQHEICCFP